MHFEPAVTVGNQTLDEFHEWNVEFALQKFSAKTTNDVPVNYVNYKRSGHVIIWVPEVDGECAKAAVYDTIRAACKTEWAGVEMVSLISEVWVASAVGKDMDALMEEYGQVRNVPGHEDALLVTTEARGGGMRMTRWVVKLKPDPAKNIMLARDDATPDLELEGRATGFFKHA